MLITIVTKINKYRKIIVKWHFLLLEKIKETYKIESDLGASTLPQIKLNFDLPEGKDMDICGQKNEISSDLFLFVSYL